VNLIGVKIWKFLIRYVPGYEKWYLGFYTCDKPTSTADLRSLHMYNATVVCIRLQILTK
jgi:hypothetical protein